MGTLIYLISAVIVALIGVWQSELLTYTNHECIANDGPFSCTYEETRDKFREAVKPFITDERHMQSYKVSSEDLEIDIAYIGSKEPTGLVIHMSGVHGAETPAGSGIQASWLRNLKNETDGAKGVPFLQPDSTVGIVFISMLNPYGMKHGRRWNENNVDLNRNLLTDKQWASVKASGGNARREYEQFDEPLFNPPRIVEWSDTLLFLPKAAYYIVRFGFNAIKKAVVTGQYYNPKGIFYLGDRIQPSYEAVTEFFQWRSDLFHKVLRTIIVDVHTGLGPAGVDTLLTDSEAVCKMFPDAPACDSFDTSATTAVAAGYELVWGTTASLAKALPLGISGSIMHLCQEFGTVPGILVLHALILENMAYHYGTNAKAIDSYRQGVRDVFYVRNADWEESVLTRGERVLDQAIEHVTKLFEFKS